MVDLSTVLLVVILAIDFVFSLWNAYASGLTWTLLRGHPGNRFAKAAAIAGMGLAFAGITYVLLIGIAFLALLASLIAVGDFVFLVSFDFLIFGAMIIGFGLVVTAQSVAIAYRERNWGSIAVSAWNVFAEVWDIAIYAQGFRTAASAVRSERGRVNVYALLAIAVAVGFLITFAAYLQGVRKAERSIEASPRQSEGQSVTVAPVPRKPPIWTHLRIVLAGIAVVVVLVAALVLWGLGPRPTVNVTTIDVWAPDNVCGLGTHPVSYAGFEDSPGSIDAFSLQIPNFNTSGCVLHSTTTNTSGFSLSNVQVPVMVPGGGNGTLSLTITLPQLGYHGVLDLVYS